MDDQLSLFDQPDQPPPQPAPPPPTRSAIDDYCTQFMFAGDRAALVAYLQGLCEQGYHWQVTQLCRIRRDLGLKVVSGQVQEFYQPGDTVRIVRQGQFYSKSATIEALENGIATVRGENWVVSHRYSVADLRLMARDIS